MENEALNFEYMMRTSGGSENQYNSASFNEDLNMLDMSMFNSQDSYPDPDAYIQSTALQDQNADLHRALFSNSPRPPTGITPVIMNSTLPSGVQREPAFNGGSHFPVPETQNPWVGNGLPVNEDKSSNAAPTSNASGSSEKKGGSQPSDSAPKPKRQRRSRKKKQESDDEKLKKREKFLERNREAAQKCRVKKKQQTSKLEEDAKLAQRINMGLRLDLQHLYQQVHELREILSAHSVCTDPKVAEYYQRLEMLKAHPSHFDYAGHNMMALPGPQSRPISRQSYSSFHHQLPMSRDGSVSLSRHGSLFMSDQLSVSRDGSVSMPRSGSVDSRPGTSASMGSGDKHDSGVSNMGSPFEKQKLDSPPEDEGFAGAAPEGPMLTSGLTAGCPAKPRMMPNQSLPGALHGDPTPSSYQFGPTDLPGPEQYMLGRARAGSIAMNAS
jgi:hypothetical protein